MRCCVEGEGGDGEWDVVHKGGDGEWDVVREGDEVGLYVLHDVKRLRMWKSHRFHRMDLHVEI